jgi:hypothetical protein
VVDDLEERVGLGPIELRYADNVNLTRMLGVVRGADLLVEDDLGQALTGALVMSVGSQSSPDSEPRRP